jgi:hypothetical protein
MRALPFVTVAALAACSDPTPTKLHFVEGEVALGQILCGTSRSGTLTVINTGDAAADVTVVPTLPDVKVTPVDATIPPGEQKIFELAVEMPPIGTPGWKSRGDLRVTTDDAEFLVPLSYETAGVSVSLGRYRTVDFGEFPPSLQGGEYADAYFQTTAVGVELTDVIAAVGPPSSPVFEITSVQSTHVSLRLPGIADLGRHEATLPIRLIGEGLCSPAEMSVDLVGVITSAPVFVNRTVLDLGVVDPCELAQGSVLVSNFGPSSTYSATLYDPSDWLDFQGTPGGDLNGATIGVIATDSAKRPPAGPLDGRVTVTYTGGSKTIPIRGMLLSHTATPANEYLALGDVPTGTTVSRKVTVENTGNTVASVRASGDRATVTPQAVQIAPGGTHDLWVSFTADYPAGTQIGSQVELSFGPSCSAKQLIKLRGGVVD